jgi:DNA-binding FadR family transcriptional regulator
VVRLLCDRVIVMHRGAAPAGGRHRWRPARAQFRAVNRLALSHAEHARVVQAILRGDRAGATDAMRDHIGIVRDAWRSLAQGR